MKASQREYRVDWTPYEQQKWTAPGDTTVPLNTLQKLANAIEKLPEGMVLQPQVEKMMEERRLMTAGKLPINWGYAETLAYASLLNEGYPVRLSGQDSARGTFAHRHAVLHDYQAGKTYTPLAHVSTKQASFEVIDSLLSEEAVLGFEYGYATAEPEALVLWEAQFGDFTNGAQVVIDQFISSGEQKWGRLCALVMLLPHGYEGMGPEHSSARLERFLQLCAEDNIQVCVPSTPAQIFHLLRRQLYRPVRKSLVVMSPKSLLRHKLAVSRLEELATGGFQLIIPEVDTMKPDSVEKIILCSGKVYYDLYEYRRSNALKNTALVRIEQLYPFPEKALSTLLKEYKKTKQVIWCQEEPKNQGAWYSTHSRLLACLTDGQTLEYVGRKAAAAPAAGYHALHQAEQMALLKEAFS